MREELLQAVSGLQLPPNFLDLIIDELGGPGQVAEMTGRKGRIVRVQPNDMDSLNITEKDAFLRGSKRVAVISDAASTGISLHASRTARNQRRRRHLTIELPWSADKAIQQLGRSHRSNQASAPVYKLISTRIGGEKRFAAAVARRLQSLGALTRGDRRAASGVDLSEQNFDSPIGRNLLQTSTSSSHLFRHTPGGGDVRRFLNRLLGLRVEEQALMFAYYAAVLGAEIQKARAEGKYSEGLADVAGTHIQLQRGSRTQLGGASYFDMDRADLDAKYLPPPEPGSPGEEALEAVWRAAWRAALDTCMHGPACRAGPQCGVGRRITTVNVLCGSVVRLWGVLEAVLARREDELPKMERSLRVQGAKASACMSAVQRRAQPQGQPPAAMEGMGFSAAQAERALWMARGDCERAVELCLEGMC
eukprot:XP_001693553.1 predicted protein [Chlamydomonas reinhardtii]